MSRSVTSRAAAFPGPLSLAKYKEWGRATNAFESLVAVNLAATGTAAIEIDGAVLRARPAPVSGPFFEGLYRRRPQFGRWLESADDRVGDEAAAVVSTRFWMRAAGGDPAFVGRRLTWNGNRSLRVVGVAPEGVDYPIGTDIWAPALAVFDGRAGRFDARNRTFAQFELIGRLRPGISADSARAQLTIVHRGMVDSFPAEIRSMEVAVEPFIDTVLGDDRRLLLALFIGAGLVFGVAGVNVAALLLMRASAHDLDRAVRVALGASRLRLVRQALAEAAVLATAGAVAGLLLSHVLLAWLPYIAPEDLPRLDRARLDLPAVAFAVAAVTAWLGVFGTVPVWGRRGAANLAAIGRAFQGARRSRGLLLFASLPIAAAVLLAIGAGLFVRSFARLSGIDRGVAIDQVYLATLMMPEDQRRDAAVQTRFHKEVVAELAAVPGITAASPIHLGPGTGTLGLSAPICSRARRLRRRAPIRGRRGSRCCPSTSERSACPSSVAASSPPTIDARPTGGDCVRIGRQAVLAESRPGRSPAALREPGRLAVGDGGRCGPRHPLPRAAEGVDDGLLPGRSVSFFQPGSLLVRTQLGPEALRAELTARVAQAMPGALVDTVEPLGRLLARELARPRAAVAVAGTFALVAIGLALVGIYGVLSYDVRQRRRELAIRAALGASPPRLVRHVAGRGATAASAGALIGVSVAALMTQGLGAVLFEVSPLDSLVYLLVLVAVPLLVVSAVWVPARAAARTDAAATLRSD